MDIKHSDKWKKVLIDHMRPLSEKVKAHFKSKGAIGSFSFNHTNTNPENEKPYYNIDACYRKSSHVFNFMIETIEANKDTGWVFKKNEYPYHTNINKNSFLHPFDFFSKNAKCIFDKFPYCRIFPDKLGPITNNAFSFSEFEEEGDKVKRIINQMAKVFIDQIIMSLDAQINVKDISEHVVYNIPIIVTEADLYVLKEGLRFENISEMKNKNEAFEEKNIVLYRYKAKEELCAHNRKKLSQFAKKISYEVLKERNESFTDDVNKLIEVIAQKYTPSMFLIVKHDDKGSVYDKIFNYINTLVEPSSETKNKLNTLNDYLYLEHSTHMRIAKIKEDFDDSN